MEPIATLTIWNRDLRPHELAEFARAGHPALLHRKPGAGLAGRTPTNCWHRQEETTLPGALTTPWPRCLPARRGRR